MSYLLTREQLQADEGEAVWPPQNKHLLERMQTGAGGAKQEGGLRSA
jgi:hypothetical protein